MSNKQVVIIYDDLIGSKHTRLSSPAMAEKCAVALITSGKYQLTSLIIEVRTKK